MARNYTFVLGSDEADATRQGWQNSKLREDNRIIRYNETQAFNSSLLIDNNELEIKIGEYLPPIKNNVFNSIYLDTHYRPVHMPVDYFTDFTSIFAVKDLTCDPHTKE